MAIIVIAIIKRKLKWKRLKVLILFQGDFPLVKEQSRANAEEVIN